MTTKEKMNAIKKALAPSKPKISKKELIDKVYEDISAKQNQQKEDDISEEDMKILHSYVNQLPNTEKTKQTPELSDDAKKALQEYFQNNNE